MPAACLAYHQLKRWSTTLSGCANFLSVQLKWNPPEETGGAGELNFFLYVKPSPTDSEIQATQEVGGAREGSLTRWLRGLEAY